jgi:hypothetical protein
LGTQFIRIADIWSNTLKLKFQRLKNAVLFARAERLFWRCRKSLDGSWPAIVKKQSLRFELEADT